MIVEVKNGEVRRYPGTYEEYVYNLEQSIGPQQTEEIIKIKPAKTDDEKKQRYEDIKNEKKKLKKIEDDIFDLEKEKMRLMRKQAKDPQAFSLDDYRHLGDLDKETKAKEDEWLKIQEDIQNLEK
jgi:hypothetical protein